MSKKAHVQRCSNNAVEATPTDLVLEYQMCKPGSTCI